MTGRTVSPPPHPWNTGFEWEDHRGPFRALTAAQARHYDEQGYVVVDELLPADVCRAAAAEIDAFESSTERFLRTLDDERLSIAEAGAITFSPHLVTRSTMLGALVRRPSLVDIAGDLLGADVNLYWDQAVYKKPEKPRRFPWHQDNGYAYVEPQQYLTLWIALTDATLENGCPQVVPGLHRRGTLAHTFVEPLGYECLRNPTGAVAAPVRAGGAVVFSSLTPHLTGPNRTDAARKAYIVQYAPTGAQRLDGDPTVGPPTARTPCDDPDRQFPVLVRGELASR